MFDFFKRKKNKNEENVQETETESTPIDQAEPAVEVSDVALTTPDSSTTEDAPSEEINTEVSSELNETSETSDQKISFAQRLKQGLSKTRKQFGNQLAGIFGGGKIDEEVYEELETILLTSDVGINATMKLLENLRKRVKANALDDTTQLKAALKAELLDLLSPLEVPLDIEASKPFIIMLAGVNGAGKTTSIGKLANAYQAAGKSVLIAAGDTFRAAAREQLKVWGERNNVHVVSQESSDAAAVMYDAIESAKAKNIDVVLADTAGRLPTQMHLMDEIAKAKRVMGKALAGAPHEILVVLDANTGQNAVTQVQAFDDALGVTGLVLSKLDGTAKGGVIAAIAEARPIPIRYIGIGEGIDDLKPFSASDFIDALFDD